MSITRLGTRGADNGKKRRVRCPAATPNPDVIMGSSHDREINSALRRYILKVLSSGVQVTACCSLPWSHVGWEGPANEEQVFTSNVSAPRYVGNPEGEAGNRAVNTGME